jgi:hypothetical protein
MPILVSFSDGSHSLAGNVDRFPTECPRCKLRNTPRFVAATVRAGCWRQICFQCQNAECRGLFLAAYIEESAAAFRFVACEPTGALGGASSSEVMAVSPGFAKLYDEALAAERLGLTRLFRLGLCAALQRLLRDFFKLESPAESNAIEHMPFGECVALHVLDSGIGRYIRSAAPSDGECGWTNLFLEGSDEGLKALVRLAVNFVEGGVLLKRLTNPATHDATERASLNGANR